MKTKQSKATKNQFLKDLDALIEAAPSDPPLVAKARAQTTPRKSWDTDGYAQQKDKERKAKMLGFALEESDVAKITLKVGPTTYTIFNTKQTLQSFRQRVARFFP